MSRPNPYGSAYLPANQRADQVGKHAARHYEGMRRTLGESLPPRSSWSFSASQEAILSGVSSSLMWFFDELVSPEPPDGKYGLMSRNTTDRMLHLLADEADRMAEREAARRRHEAHQRHILECYVNSQGGPW